MFKCTLCPKEFTNYQALASHQSFHKVINESCKVCSKNFTSQHALNGHMVWHNKSHRDRINKINENTTKKHKASIEEYNKNPKNCDECNSIISYNDYVFKSSHLKRKNIKHIFCSRKCSGIYSNSHKTHGYRRSKLEIEIEKDITQKYPLLEVHYNKKTAILSELDIYIPSLKLAFELNGIFHYEPIYGENTLKGIQNNDNRKILACAEKEIELCVIDSSGLKSMRNKKEVTKYLNIVTSIIDQKLNRLNQANGL